MIQDQQIMSGISGMSGIIPTEEIVIKPAPKNTGILHGLITNKLKWYKCEQRGDIPPGRDSHSSCFIGDKLYIFGGQGENEMIFDDFYSATITEENNKFICNWT